jgi:hypothetical protein
MANSYATVPAIIPGDLKVQGNLTVAGSNFLLGKLQRKYRIQEIANGWFDETVNVDRIAATQDDPTSLSEVRWIYPTNGPFNIATQAAGQPTTDNYLLSQAATAFLVFSNELRVGNAIPYARLGNQAGTLAFWSANLQTDLLTRDDTSKAAFGEYFNYLNGITNRSKFNSAGTSVAGIPGDFWWFDHSTHNITGVTGLQTVASKVVPANTLGPYGGLRLSIRAWITTVASGGVTAAVNFGGSSTPLAVFGAGLSGGGTIDLAIINKGVTNGQAIIIFNAGPAGLQSGAVGTWALDTTVNQTLTITTTNTLAGDQFATYAIEGQIITASGAV